MTPKLHNLRTGVCNFYLPPPWYPFDGIDALTDQRIDWAWLTHRIASVSAKLSFDPSEGNQGTKPEVDALCPTELGFARFSMSQELQGRMEKEHRTCPKT